mmetsp:Transcript_2313/g.5217  ORF Transcript_2313/g.5217 Transcript_2313/m.5217 type:complete len:213 (-) Transcript_2313:282-920(-)
MVPNVYVYPPLRLYLSRHPHRPHCSPRSLKRWQCDPECFLYAAGYGACSSCGSPRDCLRLVHFPAPAWPRQHRLLLTSGQLCVWSLIPAVSSGAHRSLPQSPQPCGGARMSHPGPKIWDASEAGSCHLCLQEHPPVQVGPAQQTVQASWLPCQSLDLMAQSLYHLPPPSPFPLACGQGDDFWEISSQFNSVLQKLFINIHEIVIFSIIVHAM